MITPTRQEQTPTGQKANWRRARAEIKERISRARKPVIAMLDRIPVQRIEINKATYQYQLDANLLLGINEEIRLLIYALLNIEQRTGKPARWFFDRYVGVAYNQGTAQSAARLSNLVTATGVDTQQVAFLQRQLDYQNILMSEPYRRRIELVYARSYENMQGFADEAARDLGRIMATGVSLGDSPRKIAANINKKFTQVEGYRALRISRTEVNKAFTTAKSEQTLAARDRLGLDVRVMHVSALVQATRRTHAFRHGKIYSVEEQNKWWAQGGNRINCLCSVVEIVYVNGEPLQQRLIDKQRARGKAYFGT